MKMILKKFVIIWTIIFVLLPTLFSGLVYAAEENKLNTERAGNFAANFAINFYENWSAYGVVEAGSVSTASKNGEYVWPLDKMVVNSEYGALRSDGPHLGTDLDGNVGDKIYACYGGEVIRVYKDCEHFNWRSEEHTCGGGFGNHVRIKDENGITIIYGHMTDVYVDVGDVIEKGQTIGTVGSTGQSDGPHLHLEFWTTDKSLLQGLIIDDEYHDRTNTYKYAYTIEPRVFIDFESGTGSSNTLVSSKIRGEIKTEYDETIDPTDSEAGVSPSDSVYKFNNLSWISFVYRNSLFRGNSGLTMDDILTGSGSTIEINKASFDDKKNIPGVKEVAEISDIIDISKLITEGKILPGDILYIQNGEGSGEYVLYVGGSKILYATNNVSAAPSGALKYEYLEYYLKRIKRKLLDGHEEDEEYVLPKYGVTEVYRINQTTATKINESDANLFYNGKGYYSYAKYDGIPEVNYNGSTKLGFKWIFSGILKILEFIVSLIIYVVKMQILGWVNIFENIIQTLVLGISGHNSSGITLETFFGTSATSASGERISVESIFFNQIPILDINFFDFNTAGGKSLLIETEVSGQVLEGETNVTSLIPDESNVVYRLRKNLAIWYNLFRNFSIAALLFILLYLGIRLAMTSIAEKKAEYKKLLLSWVTSFIIVIFVHFFMYAVIYFNNQLVTLIGNLGQDIANVAVGTSGEELNMYDAIRTKAYAFNFKEGAGATILYVYLVYLLLKFLIIYFKRFITVYILALSGSLMGIKHALEKIAGKKTTSLHKWMKDYAFNVLLQTVHALTYVLFMGIAINISQHSLPGFVLCLVVLNFITKADKIVIKIFGLDKAGSLADVNQSESWATLFANAVGKVMIGKKLYEVAETTLWGKRGLITEIRYASTGKDTYKDAEKELLKRKYERIGNRARALDEVLNKTKLNKTPIRKIFKNLDAKKKMGNRISADTNKAILANIDKVKKLKRKRYTRPIKHVKNTMFGVGGIVASIPIGIDNLTAGISTFVSARNKINSSKDLNRNVSKYSKYSISNEKARSDLDIYVRRFNNALDKYTDNQYNYEEQRRKLLDKYNLATDITTKDFYMNQINILDNDRRIEEAKELQELQEAYEEMLTQEKNYKEAQEKNSLFGKTANVFGTVTGLKNLSDMTKGELYAAEEERKKIFKEGSKIDALSELAAMEEELGELTKELKEKQKQYAAYNNLTEEESDKMLNKKLDEIVTETREQHISGFTIKRAVTEYMQENDVTKITGNDIETILDKIQEKLHSSQKHKNVNISESTKDIIRQEIEEKMIKDKKGLGYNAKDATTNIQILLGEMGMLQTQSTANINDAEMKEAYNKVLQKIKDINTYNEVARIKNKASLVDIEKIVKNVRKMK